MKKLGEVRERAESDLFYFAQLTNPTRVFGEIHESMFRMLQQEEDQMFLLPRAHMKSFCIAVYVAWKICRQPDITCIYVSSTEKLALEQVYTIKNIISSDTVMKLWPSLLHPDEGSREQWAARSVKVDHPLRREMGVRDATIQCSSVGSTSTGLHADLIIFDDLVEPNNAYTMEGRKNVSASYSQFASIGNPGCVTKIVGTHYHPADLYSELKKMEYEIFSDEGEVIDHQPMYSVMEYQVEDGAGHFLWPRTQHPRTKRWYGFNEQELAKIRAKYFGAGERVQYYAQYYNEPNDPSSNKFDHDNFQYYEKKFIERTENGIFYNDEPLAVFAAMDFAYTDNAHSDFTAIVVIGVDAEGFIYVWIWIGSRPTGTKSTSKRS